MFNLSRSPGASTLDSVIPLVYVMQCTFILTTDLKTDSYNTVYEILIKKNIIIYKTISLRMCLFLYFKSDFLF